jgi:hypothetical protein
MGQSGKMENRSLLRHWIAAADMKAAAPGAEPAGAIEENAPRFSVTNLPGAISGAVQLLDRSWIAEPNEPS